MRRSPKSPYYLGCFGDFKSALKNDQNWIANYKLVIGQDEIYLYISSFISKPCEFPLFF